MTIPWPRLHYTKPVTRPGLLMAARLTDRSVRAPVSDHPLSIHQPVGGRPALRCQPSRVSGRLPVKHLMDTIYPCVNNAVEPSKSLVSAT